MPIIEGADFSSVQTERQPLVEAEYLVTITGSEFSEDGRFLLLRHQIEEGPQDVGKPWTLWVNVKQNDGKINEIGLATIKRYLEAVYGKGSAEANAGDSDALNGSQVYIYVTQRSGKGDSANKVFNDVKRVRAA